MGDLRDGAADHGKTLEVTKKTKKSLYGYLGANVESKEDDNDDERALSLFLYQQQEQKKR